MNLYNHFSEIFFKEFVSTEDLIGRGMSFQNASSNILNGFQAIASSSRMGDEQASVSTVGCITHISRVVK